MSDETRNVQPRGDEQSRDGRGGDRGRFDRGDRGPGGRGGPRRGGRFYKRKICKICYKKTDMPDYKNPDTVRRFVTDRGKILPRRITGTCAKHQRLLTREIKRARALALLPYVSK